MDTEPSVIVDHAKVIVSNKDGIHGRPASMILEVAERFDSVIFLKCADKEADAKAIMSVLIMAAECGTEITIEACGVDAKEAVQAIKTLIESNFGEE